MKSHLKHPGWGGGGQSAALRLAMQRAAEAARKKQGGQDGFRVVGLRVFSGLSPALHEAA